jgi:acyl dehydratase
MKSKPDRGIVKWRWEVLNQRDEVVMSSIGTQFYLRRPT